MKFSYTLTDEQLMTDSVPMRYPILWGLTRRNLFNQTETYHPIPINRIIRSWYSLHYWLQRPNLSDIERIKLDAYNKGFYAGNVAREYLK